MVRVERDDCQHWDHRRVQPVALVDGALGEPVSLKRTICLIGCVPVLVGLTPIAAGDPGYGVFERADLAGGKLESFQHTAQSSSP